MEEIKKMLRAVINGQSAMKQELLEKINKVALSVDKLDGKNEQRDKRIEALAGAWKGSHWDKIDASEWQRMLRREKGI